MSNEEKRGSGLQELLEQFFISCSMNEAELELSIGYLFGRYAMLPFFKDSELFDTLTYLQEIASSQEFTTVEELRVYIEDKKGRIRGIVNNLLDEAKENGGAKVIELTSVRRDRPEVLRESTYTTLNDYYNTIEVYLQECGHSSMKRRSLFQPLELYATRVLDMIKDQETCAVKRYRISKSYLREFAEAKACNRIYLFDLGSRELDKKGIYATSLQSEIIESYQDGIGLESQMDKEYYQIITTIRQQRLIWGDQFKLKLLEWCSRHIQTCGEDGKELEDIYMTYMEKLSERKWVILTSPKKHLWITSDNPGFSISKDAVKERQYPFFSSDFLSDIRPDTILYYPLSKEYCLSIQPEEVESSTNHYFDSPIRFIEASEKEVQIVNGLTISTCKEIVASSKKDILEKYQYFL